MMQVPGKEKKQNKTEQLTWKTFRLRMIALKYVLMSKIA